MAIEFLVSNANMHNNGNTYLQIFVLNLNELNRTILWLLIANYPPYPLLLCMRECERMHAKTLAKIEQSS